MGFEAELYTLVKRADEAALSLWDLVSALKSAHENTEIELARGQEFQQGVEDRLDRGGENSGRGIGSLRARAWTS